MKQRLVVRQRRHRLVRNRRTRHRDVGLEGARLWAFRCWIFWAGSALEAAAIASAHAFRPQIQDMAEDIAQLARARAERVKVGFGKKDDAHLGYEHERDIAFVKTVREVIGPTPDIMIDLGVKVCWDVSTAIRRVRRHGRVRVGID